ncbi:uncharacterized protein LOC6543131 isoform X3 [Drosophila erecta]|uniref:uncharacterized protein LOC6543131 isoform X3 n=1 Tax=Drosophila erecta TaxID=7220 RepID=UPI000F066FA0|nr:uncharacterized protein LOC6543131 isoform X3 [Drosophila erecta]
MGDSPEERRSKDTVPEPSAKEAETGKGKKEKKEKSAEGSKPRPASSQRGSLTKSHIGVSLPMGAPAAKPTMRFMPTYRLESKNPLNKERVENIIKAVMNRHYNDEYMFHPKHSLHMAAQVSEEIKNRIKLDNYDSAGYCGRVPDAGPLLHGQLPVGC